MADNIQVGPNTIATDDVGGVHFQRVLYRPDAIANSAVTSVAAVTSTATILAANASRAGMLIYNGGTATMYVKFGSGATTSSYSFQLAPAQTYEASVTYSGLVTATWSATGGSALITELT